MSSTPAPTPPSAAPAARSSLRSISLLTGSMFAQFALQFAYQLALAKWYGAGLEMDAFQAAHTIPLVVSTILVGSLQYAFVPVFVQKREAEGPESAWLMAGTIGLILIPGIALLSLAGCLAAGPIITSLFPGYSPEQSALAVSLFQILVWLTWTVSVTAFFQTVLQSAQIYRPAASGPVVGTVVTFVASWLCHRSWGIHGIAWATVVGALVALIWQAPIYWKNARHRWSLDDGTRRVWLLLLPLLLGAAIYKLDPLLDRYLASSLPEGSVSRLSYASRLIAAFLTLTSNGLAMVVFPVLASHAARNERQELKSELSHALQFLTFLLMPLCAALIVFRVPIIRDLFERGRFIAADTQAVADLLALFVGMLIGGSLGEILSKTHFALGDTRTPTIVRMFGFLIGAGLKFWWGTRYGLRGLVLATSVYYLLIAGLDWFTLRYKLGRIPLRDVWLTMARCAVSTLLAVGAGQVVLAFSQQVQGASVWSGIAGAIVYVSAAYGFRDTTAGRIADGVGRRFTSKR